jgi:hypothetical protein
MAQATASQAAASWKAGMAGAGSKWSQGVANCQVNPMQLASQAVDTAVANYTAQAPQMAAKLAAYPVGNWKAACASPAAQSNYTNGAAKGQAKYTAAVTKLAATVWPGQKAASVAAGGGSAGMVAAYQFVQQAKANGQTK